MIKKLFKGILLAAAILICSALIAKLPINTGKNLHKGLGEYNELCGISDSVDLMDKSEIKELNSLIRETADKTELNITILLGNVHMPTDEQALEACHSFYDQTYGEYTDGIFLYLDLAGKSSAIDAISTSGKAHIIYKDHISDLLNAMYVYLPASGEKIYSEDVSMAIEAFCEKLKQYKKNFKPSSFEYEYDSKAKTPVYTYFRGDKLYITKQKAPGARFKVMLTGSLIGTVLYLILYFSIKKNYKFKGSTNPSVYVSHGETTFNEKSDTYIRSYTTRHKIQSNSGGGSHSGGGGGGHSGSHGGGTGHR